MTDIAQDSALDDPLAAVGGTVVPLRSVYPQRREEDRWKVLRRSFLLADCAAAMAAMLVVAAVGQVPLDRAIAFAPLNALAWAAALYLLGLYDVRDLRQWASGVSEIPRLGSAAFLLSWPALAAETALGWGHPASALLTVAATATLSGLTRGTARVIVHCAAPLRQRTLILGSGSVASMLVDKLLLHREYGLDPIGIVDDDVHRLGPDAVACLGRLPDLGRILQEQSVDRVIVAFSRVGHERLNESIRVCRAHGVAVDVVPRLFEFVEGSLPLQQIGAVPVLSLNTLETRPRAQAAKRAFDMLVSGLALLVLAPVIVVIAVAIKLESPGPVFFRQSRAGRHRRAFDLIKFRSMYVDAEDKKGLLRDANDVDDGVMFKIHDDPRITKPGRFLRRSSLDELPQLINVLKGDMSLVGPRPLIFPEIDQLRDPWQEQRLQLRPGITGPWQISGRSHSPFQEMVRLDYHYVVQWSFWRDIEILLATIPVVLSRRGAY
jgi:exopolysaccharide biosynthesis polyprenyl glycosylphosphotransferase